MPRVIIVFLIFCSFGLYAQPIFPGMSGTQLLGNLVTSYKPSSVLSLANTKDTMYSTIYNFSDSLSCVYTGFTMYIDPALDPSQAAYQNGAGINQEHLWPRSKGASSGNAERDMHHLRPTRVDVNSARSSYDFDEIPDSQTDRWYRNSSNTTSPPSQNRDEYSELDSGGTNRFEPREDYKGDVARAMFYFYTMYKQEADNSGDSGFFTRQKDVWRSWNAADPVDQTEIDRTWVIASYQSARPNPFVLDTSLIGRAYFGVVTGIENEDSENLQNQIPETVELRQNYPNPFNPKTTISFVLQKSVRVQLTVYDVHGRHVQTILDDAMPAGEHTVDWNGFTDAGDAAATGIYFYKLSTNEQVAQRRMILLR